MKSVIILGGGNVASHLTRAFFKSKKVDLVQVYSRKLLQIEKWRDKTSITDDLTKLKDADVYIISISDDAIEQFSKELQLAGKLVVHTSGSVHMDALKTDRKGVFYPLQTFTKGKKVNFKKIPICIETSEKEDLLTLEKLATKISKKVFIIDSDQREKLHLGAVIVNNFTNHLYSIGKEICDKNDVPFEVLLPLIEETTRKVKTMAPLDAQTGPAKRNDRKTIEKQISQLTGNQKEIYKIITQSIVETYKKNGKEL